MISRVTFGKSFYLLCTITLVVLFAVDTLLQLRRYLQGQVTVARTVEQHDSLHLPAISFCPGYRRGVMERLRWPVAFVRENTEEDWQEYEKTFPKSDAEAKEAWDSMTFKLEEVLQVVYWQKLNSSDQYEDMFVTYNASRQVEKTRI